MPKCIILIAAVSLFSILHFTTLNGDLDPPCQLVKWQWELNSLYSGLMDHPDIFYWARTAAPGRPACCSEVIALDAQRGTFPRRDAGQSKRKIMSKPGVMFLFFCIISVERQWPSPWRRVDLQACGKMMTITTQQLNSRIEKTLEILFTLNNK